MQILPNHRQLKEMDELSDSYSDTRIFDVLQKLCNNVSELQIRIEKLEPLLKTKR